MREENPDITQFECSVFNGIYVTKDVDQSYLEYTESLRSDDAKALRGKPKRKIWNCITKANRLRCSSGCIAASAAVHLAPLTCLSLAIAAKSA